MSGLPFNKLLVTVSHCSALLNNIPEEAYFLRLFLVVSLQAMLNNIQLASEVLASAALERFLKKRNT